jgi:hypothetical protein
MQRVFISNNTEVASGKFIISNDFDAANLPVTDEHKSGNIIFIIDCHCTFKGAEKIQQQGGVIIYRHLLKLFEGKQDKLKVVFYSPIPKHDLVKLKPENYVVKLMPFVECKYEEGQFENELTKIVSDNEFPQFNNASENLLSGWAASGAEPIQMNADKKPLIIDDQIVEWKETYNQLFGKNEYNIYSKEEITESIEKIRANEGYDLFSGIRDSLFVISDFYLTENHDSDLWKDRTIYKTISGFQLYAKAKSVFRCKPWMLQTSSNRIYNYELFDDWGIDKWVVKDIRPDVKLNEKIQTYQQFNSGILLLKNMTWMDELWKKFMPLEKKLKSKSVDELLKEKWWVKELFYYYDSKRNKNFNSNQSDSNYRIDCSDTALKTQVEKSLNFIVRKTIVDTLLGIRRQYRKPFQYERNRLGVDDVTVEDLTNLDEFACYAGILYLFTVIEFIYRINTYHPQKDMNLTWGNETQKSRKNKQIEETDPGKLLYKIRNDVTHIDRPFSPSIEHLKVYVKCVVDLLLLKDRNTKSFEFLIKTLNNSFYPDKNIIANLPDTITQ